MDAPLIRRLSCLCALLAGGFAGSAASGEVPERGVPAADTGRDELPAIVVTATRDARPAFELPASIDAVDLDDRFDGLGVALSESLDAVPGVLVRNRQNFAQDEQISIRGFGARASFGVRGVRLLSDGIPATMPDGQGQVSHFNLDSAARIEVLRGPFSALYGNSAGGVIQVFTADGRDAPGVRASFVAGGSDARRTSVNARGASDTIDYHLDVSHFETGGWREHSRARRDSLNAKVNVELGARGHLTLVANAFDQPWTEDPLGLTRTEFEDDPRQATAAATSFDTRKRVAQNQVGAIWTRDLAAQQELRIATWAGQRDVEQFLSIPPLAQAAPLGSGGVIDLGSTYAGADLRWTRHAEIAGRPLDLSVGVSLDRQRQHRRGYENFVGEQLGVRGALRRDEDDTVGNVDEYAQATWQFAETWSLMLGARHSRVRFRTRDHYVSADNPDDSGSVRYTATTPVAGLVYRASDALRVYAAYGSGFETPTFSELAYRNDGAAGLNFDLDAARSRNIEIGAKLHAGPIDATLAAFRADTRDELAVATNAGGRTTYRNVGRSRREGAEASLVAHFGDAWSARLAWTRVDARFRTAFLACAERGCDTPDTPVPAGTRIPGVPRTTAFAALRYGSDETWHVELETNRVAAVPVDDVGRDRAPAYVVAALEAGITHPVGATRVRAFARIDNLFDRKYVGSVIVNDGNGRYFEPAPGRTFMLGARVEWR
jgi:iron complex outermembrane receptor protein